MRADVLADRISLKQSDPDAYVLEMQKIIQQPVHYLCGHSWASYNLHPEQGPPSCDECGGLPQDTDEGRARWQRAWKNWTPPPYVKPA